MGVPTISRRREVSCHDGLRRHARATHHTISDGHRHGTDAATWMLTLEQNHVASGHDCSRASVSGRWLLRDVSGERSEPTWNVLGSKDSTSHDKCSSSWVASRPCERVLRCHLSSVATIWPEPTASATSHPIRASRPHRYTAPEMHWLWHFELQRRGKKEAGSTVAYTSAIDLWAVGCVAYQVLCGV